MSNSDHIIDIGISTTSSTPDGPLGFSVSNISWALWRSNGRQHGITALWFCLQVLIAEFHISTSVIVLVLSKHEDSSALLRALIACYMFFNSVALPMLIWDYRHWDQMELVPGLAFNVPVSLMYFFTRGPNWESTSTVTGKDPNAGVTSRSSSTEQVENIRLLLIACFIGWFCFGGLVILLESPFASKAPILYGISVIFFTFFCSGVGLLCFLSSKYWSRDDGVNDCRISKPETVIDLSVYKFLSKKDTTDSDKDKVSSAEEGRVVAAGTNKEHMISEEDAVCVICLAIYADNDELRELPCSHLLHKECVDKWLDIDLTCPLCKSDCS